MNDKIFQFIQTIKESVSLSDIMNFLEHPASNAIIKTCTPLFCNWEFDIMVKAILVVVSDGFGGYGDFLFALKLSQGLKQGFAKNGGISPPIYLITQDTGKAKIKRLGGDVEFDITILTPDELTIRINSADPNERIEIGEIMEGPIFKSELIEKIDEALIGHDPVPLTMITEYNVSDGLKYTCEYRAQKLKQLIYNQCISSGFVETEGGVFLTDSLKKSDDPIRLQQDLDPDINAILGDIEDYQKTIELSMQYSHDAYPDMTVASPTNNSIQHFLEIHREYCLHSDKNQDVLMVGANTHYKKSALVGLKDKLISDGFQRISFYDVLEKKEEIIYDSGQPGRSYRGLYVKGMSHKSMIACTALSGPLFGATGDQSLGEALSANKIMVYELLLHKTDLINAYDREMRQASHGNVNIENALTLLRTADNTMQYQQLGYLVRMPSVVDELKQRNQSVISKHNLIASVFNSSITRIKYHIVDLLGKKQIDSAINFINQQKLPMRVMDLLTKNELASYYAKENTTKLRSELSVLKHQLDDSGSDLSLREFKK